MYSNSKYNGRYIQVYYGNSNSCITQFKYYLIVIRYSSTFCTPTGTEAKSGTRTL